MEDQFNAESIAIDLTSQSKAWGAFYFLKRALFIFLLAILTFQIIYPRSGRILGHAVAFGATIIGRVNVHIEGIFLNPAEGSLRIKGLTVDNPKGFPKGRFVDFPNIEARCDFPALLKGRLHFKEVDMDLRELVLITDAQGKFNVDSFKFTGKNPSADAKKNPEHQAHVDILNLYIGKLVSKDYTPEATAQVCVHNIQARRTYRNVTGILQLKSIVLAAPLKEAGIKGALVCGTAILAGPWAVPVALAVVVVGKDNAEENLNIPYRILFARSVALLERLGTIKKADSSSGVIIASVQDARIAVKIKKIDTSTSTNIIVSARKIFLPKPEIAAGILYQINEELK